MYENLSFCKNCPEKYAFHVRQWTDPEKRRRWLFTDGLATTPDEELFFSRMNRLTSH
jgi:hypothetical protein